MTTRTVYIVDDDGNLRDTIEAALLESWEESSPADRPRVCTREFIWRLRGSREVATGNVAVCDLYPSLRFWSEAPRPPEPVAQFPDDPRNLVIATKHIIEGYLVPMQSRGLRILVFSYIPAFLDEERFGKEASEIRSLLTTSKLELLEKADRSDCPANLGVLVARVNELLAEGGTGNADREQ